MGREAIGHLGGKAWQERLQALQEEGGELEVPEGFCRVAAAAGWRRALLGRAGRSRLAAGDAARQSKWRF